MVKKLHNTSQTKPKAEKAIIKAVKPLSAMEIVFAEDYLTNGFNKAKAARTAGIKEHTCREQGYQIYNRSHVKEYIQNILKERIITSAENQKLISDTALSSITDYYVPVATVKYKKIRVGLQVLIDRIQEEHDLEDDISEMSNLTDKQNDKHFEGQQYRLAQIIRYKAELNRNPNATRIIDSDPELVDEMQLDINALVADKEKGKVKSISYTRDGLKVEMYSAETARDQIAKMHGDFKKDNEQQAQKIFISKVEVVKSNAPKPAGSEKEINLDS